MASCHWSWFCNCYRSWRSSWPWSQVSITISHKFIHQFFSAVSWLLPPDVAGWIYLTFLRNSCPWETSPLGTYSLSTLRWEQFDYRENTEIHLSEGSCQCERSDSLWRDWKRSDWTCGQPDWPSSKNLQVKKKQLSSSCNFKLHGWFVIYC